MNSKTLFKAMVIAIALAATSPTKAGSSHLTQNFSHDANFFHDPGMDEFIVELSTYRDSGRTVLRDRIQEIEKTEGQFSPRLYGYLAELGRIHRASAEYDLAIDAFQRMQTLTHWADGVDSPWQLESVRLQSRSMIAKGKLHEADKLERFHYRVSEKNFHGEDLLPSIWRIGMWQRMTMQYNKALDSYDQALALIETEQLPSAYAVQAMEAKALTEHLAKRCCASQSLENALAGRLNSDFSDEVANQTALLNLADLKILYAARDTEALFTQVENAPAALLGPKSKNAYLKALDSVDRPMQQLHTEVWYPEKTATFTFGKETEPEPITIGEPVRLCTNKIESEGFVDVSLDVAVDGTAKNVTITGEAPHMTKKYLRAVLLKSRYRPEIRNGEAVEQTLAFRQYFDRAKPVRSDLVSGWRDLIAEHACQIMAMR